MATKTIAWTTGSGNITLTYTGQGNGSISVASDENDSFDERSQSFDIVTTNGSPEKAVSILVKQEGKKYAVGDVFNFDYTGSVQEITLPKGRYKLQCWGAQGGDVTGTYPIVGSRGGYSEGVLTLTKTTTLYIFVGGKGTDYTSSASQTSTTVLNGGWNGGGAGVRTARYSSGDTDGRSFPRGGGGATDISTVTSTLSYSSGRTTRDSASLLARCIVAGGGAGASARVTKVTTTSSGTSTVGTYKSNNYYLSGGLGVYIYLTANISVTAGETYYITNISCPVNYSKVVINWRNSSGTTLSSTTGTTGTAPSGAVYMQVRVDTTSAVDEGVSATSLSFTLQKDSTTTSTSTTSGLSNALQQGGGTSGRGQYPGTQTSAGSGGAFGLGASQSSTNYRYCGGGGGGGWYGGGTNESDSSTSYVNYSGGGSGFVNTAANAASRPSGYTGLQLDSGTTTDGNNRFESVGGSTEKGHGGNGYARITVLS